MSKHEESQSKVDALRVGDEIATPGIRGVVLMKGVVYSADDSRYAGLNLLTTVAGNSYQPFRSALFYYQDDDPKGWQSGGGRGFSDLAEAVRSFQIVEGSSE